MSVVTFINKNIVVIVMVPAIIGSHYGWRYLQEQDSLVKPEERKGFPFVDMMHKIPNFFKGGEKKE